MVIIEPYALSPPKKIGKKTGAVDLKKTPPSLLITIHPI